MKKNFQCGRFRFPLNAPGFRPLVMGILNVTPDSFSDGGKFTDLDAALAQVDVMLNDGVDIIDIGAESSRPGAAPLSLQQELDRLMPLVFAIRDCGKAISVDTYKPTVMKEVLLAGVDMINDISGFASVEAIAAVASSDAGLCVMHMQQQPQTMQQAPAYLDVVSEVASFLQSRKNVLIAAGVEDERICLDPGFGFGKTLAHNVTLFKNTPHLIASLDSPLLIGVSRKSMIGGLTGREIEHRLAGSLSAALAAAHQGAAILRVHDVKETVDALKVWNSLSDMEWNCNV
ncbi:dihydropteroate synthase [Undibacterium sp. CY7W]|uniref:Dihydropteroate synthase n=1 Tax=Undibacterium rugosum TaxID=2762291 RepID=A0A923I1E4_9BURK|nr:dihydropteroate synthase [Undibacterium rugosum]MBC3935881.1 dihydropteroate synthase [Undibacterium rugosum]